MIEAVLIDSREPSWVQKLNFGCQLHSVIELPVGDVQAVTDDGHTLLIERKTADDLLGSMKDERLFPQMARLAEGRLDELINGKPPTQWPYLVICGPLTPNADGHIATERGQTVWLYTSVMGALLSIQEMGIFVVFSTDFEQTVISLGKRSREGVQKILPPRPGILLGPGSAILASLPGIGTERAVELMRWSNNNVAHALVGLTDPEISCPIGEATRRRIRATLGLTDNQTIELVLNKQDQEILRVMEMTNV